MNKDNYKSALDKVRASEAFKTRAEASLKTSESGKRAFQRKKLVPILIALVLVIGIGTEALRWNNKTNPPNDFKIIGSTDSNEEACYASIIYLDGYVYSTIEWLGYSRFHGKGEYERIKGEKLGEVTLDLKGLKYTGPPPNLSSTLDEGTKIYKIKNVKSERAVLVELGDDLLMFYRMHKEIMDENTPLNLTIQQVFEMLSDTPAVSEVELRDENDGSWMRTAQDRELLSLINRELPKLSLLNRDQFGKDPYKSQHRIPLNLMFADGAALHVQFFPEVNAASIFGGYVSVSTELSRALEKLYKQGNEYGSISSLLSYEAEDINYLYFEDYVNHIKVLCKNPQWSRQPLFSIFDYYRVKEVDKAFVKNLVMTSTLGKSMDDSISIGFYETQENDIAVKIGEHYYKPAKGQIKFDELSSYLHNYTDLDLK